MHIVFATDHAGFELKNELAAYVRDELGYEVVDYGAMMYDEGDDFPDYIKLAATAVAADPSAVRGIILGGSGQGEAMCANRFAGVRAAVYYGGLPKIVSLSREHNDANVLSLGARFIDTAEAKEVVQRWLDTAFSGVEKYQRRNQKLDV